MSNVNRDGNSKTQKEILKLKKKKLRNEEDLDGLTSRL